MQNQQSEDSALVEAFTDLYWNQVAPWTKTRWLGVGVAKCPLDLFVYQEILFETRPDLLIEAGSCLGGSALFFASVFDLIGHGEVLTIDKDSYPEAPKHSRIRYLTGDSVSPEIVSVVHAAAKGKRVMVVLDSLHTYEHVAAELLAYGPLVAPGCYMVVEDTGVDESWGKPAALQATKDYMAVDHAFAADRGRELHLLTFNKEGWLVKK